MIHMIIEHISVYNMPLLPPVQDASQVIWTTNGATKLQMTGKHGIHTLLYSLLTRCSHVVCLCIRDRKDTVKGGDGYSSHHTSSIN
jgi:hypothetical protein